MTLLLAIGCPLLYMFVGGVTLALLPEDWDEVAKTFSAIAWPPLMIGMLGVWTVSAVRRRRSERVLARVLPNARTVQR